MRSKRAERTRAFAAERFAATRQTMLPLAAAIALACAGGARAATIAVNDASDDSVPGKCTLADAVAALNASAAVNGCAAGDGSNDTIDLSFFSAATTIAFSNPNSSDRLSAIETLKPVTISGPVDAHGKPLVTIARAANAGVRFRVLATSASLTLQNAVITGGLASVRGAGVYAKGHANLTIANCVVSGNSNAGGASYSGGGIATQYGDIAVSNSIVSDNYATNNGGGIYTLHEGAITVSNSTISGNHADYAGGGIYSFNGNVTINGSTISGNRVFKSYYYNGVFQPTGGVSGGGVNVFQTLRMTNSTVTGNYSRSGGGGVAVYAAFYGRPARAPRRAHPSSPTATPNGNAYLYFCTIAGNTGDGNIPAASGFVGANYIKAVGTIIKNNALGDMSIQGNAQFVGSNNIIGNPPFRAPADTRDCDPMLGSLGDYGGSTQTLPLLDGSCAIDTGPDVLPAGIATDQRGFDRPFGVKSDVGAVEKQGDNDPLDPIFSDGFEASG